MSMTLAAVVAKLAGLSVPAKAAVGIAIAAGAVTAAGPAVGHVADSSEGSVVESVTTSDVAEPAATESPDDEAAPEDVEGAEPAEDIEEGEPVEESDEVAEQPELPEAASFGQSVAEDARDGGVDGQQISARAQERAEARRLELSAGAEARASAHGAASVPDDASAAAPDTQAPTSHVGTAGRP